MASAILSARTAIYTSEQLLQIKTQMTQIDTYLERVTETITEQYDQLVTITKVTDSLYEFNHKYFCILTEQQTKLQCKKHQEL